jgi:predicted Zn-dependent protease
MMRNSNNNNGDSILRKRYIVYLLFVALFAFGIHTLNGIPKTFSNGLTKADVQEVYNNLQKYTGLPGQIPPVTVLDDPQINAWMTPDGMFVTTGILHFVKNKDELAAVMGHEMGHYVLQHFQLDGDSRLHEANADKFGLFVMMRAGYDPCVIEGLWQRMGRVFGDDILTDSHPSPSQRADEMHFPMCHPFDN